ncbi:hypothetical protein CgunFtcFv8_014609 [Champsocephalus gunnari]|uniref:Uncharacterized protein n=1 Tax=Champsocephalus gunnari TaxID=52237 RepID=A0AAN8I045_CHAGU|nr:hypothetical protein CgunFtcFv8_014609 [Champsocephalus gunnari]
MAGKFTKERQVEEESRKMEGRMVGEGGVVFRAGYPSLNSTLCALGNPLPVAAHGTQRYKAAARHTHAAYDVGG